MDFEKYERETVITSNDDSNVFKVYTLQGKMITKMRKAGVVPDRVDANGAHYYTINLNQLSIRNGKKREMSEEQKAKAAERMRNMHKKGMLKG